MVADPPMLEGDSSAREAGEALSRPEVRAVFVSDDGRLLGVVTRKTLVREVVAAGRDPRATKLREIAEVPLNTIGSDLPLDEAFRFLEEQDLKRVPVLEDGRLVGVLSRAVLQRRLAEDEPPPDEDSARLRLGRFAFLPLPTLFLLARDVSACLPDPCVLLGEVSLLRASSPLSSSSSATMRFVLTEMSARKPSTRSTAASSTTSEGADGTVSARAVRIGQQQVKAPEAPRPLLARAALPRRARRRGGCRARWPRSRPGRRSRGSRPGSPRQRRSPARGPARRVCARCSTVSDARRVVCSATLSNGIDVPVDALGLVRHQSEVERRDRRHRPGDADRALRLRRRAAGSARAPALRRRPLRSARSGGRSRCRG